jgi:queuine tRNA-ribosyltransferase
MVFDECTPYPVTEDEARESMELSMRWADRSRRHFDKLKEEEPDRGEALFGIVQGGIFHALRNESLRRLCEIGFDGYAIGGLAVGEPDNERIEVLDNLLTNMPADKPRYLMGVGTPLDIADAVGRGVDLFDCVMPTRHARTGHLFRAPVHVAGNRQDPQCAFRDRYRPTGSALRLLYLSTLQPGVPAASREMRGNPRFAAGNNS